MAVRAAGRCDVVGRVVDLAALATNPVAEHPVAEESAPADDRAATAGCQQYSSGRSDANGFQPALWRITCPRPRPWQSGDRDLSCHPSDKNENQPATDAGRGGGTGGCGDCAGDDNARRVAALFPPDASQQLLAGKGELSTGQWPGPVALLASPEKTLAAMAS